MSDLKLYEAIWGETAPSPAGRPVDQGGLSSETPPARSLSPGAGSLVPEPSPSRDRSPVHRSETGWGEESRAVTRRPPDAEHHFLESLQELEDRMIRRRAAAGYLECESRIIGSIETLREDLIEESATAARQFEEMEARLSGMVGDWASSLEDARAAGYGREQHTKAELSEKLRLAVQLLSDTVERVPAEINQRLDEFQADILRRLAVLERRIGKSEPDRSTPGSGNGRSSNGRLVP